MAPIEEPSAVLADLWAAGRTGFLDGALLLRDRLAHAVEVEVAGV
jgi:hypothetical protein